MKKRNALSFLCCTLVCLLILSACSSGKEINGKIAMEITTSDGRSIDAFFYPAAKPDAPVVILAHWARSGQEVWEQVAYWLQNRGFAGTSESENNSDPWLDSTWFPEMPADRTYNVLTFSCDGCGEAGCRTNLGRDKWVLDMQAAFEAARTLESVDPARVVGIGASIGADGVVGECLYLNSKYLGTCRGALSLSPGNYLPLDYYSNVKDLLAMDPSVPVQCFYSSEDRASEFVCQVVQDIENVTVVEYQGSNHGMELIQPGLEHNALTIVLQFLSDTLGG
ncbi:MAG: hypothetical protein GYA18_10855 [Chloroflexi bacterium]|nr:hypothetical protein [Chloroflexota bacterium]